MSTQSELKENVLASKLEGTVQWVMVRRFQVLAVTGIVVLSSLVVTFLIIKRNEDIETLRTRLAQGEMLLSQKQYAQARPLLTEIKTAGGKEPVGLLAGYYLGVVNLEDQKYADAINAFIDVVDTAGKNPIRPLALSNLGFAYEQNNDPKAAAETYKRFMSEYADHFLAPRVQLSRGRALMLSGDVAGAKEVLGQLVDIYPTSTWAQRARLIMDKLQTR